MQYFKKCYLPIRHREISENLMVLGYSGIAEYSEYSEKPRLNFFRFNNKNRQNQL